MNVQAWLDSIADCAEAEGSLKRKRGQRSDRRQIPTPEGGSPQSSEQPSRKHPKVSAHYPPDDNADSDEEGEAGEYESTPRPGTQSGVASLPMSSSRSLRSTTSTRASPTKRLARLRIARENPVVVKPFSQRDESLPGELLQVVHRIKTFHKEKGIIPQSLASEIALYREQNYVELSDDDDDVFFDDNATDGQDDQYREFPGGLPALKDIMDIFHAGAECYTGAAPEPTWNSMVHNLVFMTALGVPVPNRWRRSDDQGGDIKVHALPCTTARLNGSPKGAKMVDYCIFVDPDDAPAREAIDDICQESPYSTINHTDLFALASRPIVISAESKKPGEDWANSLLQLAVWQSHHWALLEAQQRQRRGAELTDSGAQDKRLRFLPAFLIQGHQWSFAASTRENGKTVCITPTAPSPVHQISASISIQLSNLRSRLIRVSGIDLMVECQHRLDC